MAVTGQRLQHRLRKLLRLGRKELVSQAKAARVLAGAPEERTLRDWESGKVGLRQLHYAVGLGRRSATFRNGLITLMESNPTEAVWWRVPRKSLWPSNLVFLLEVLGAEPADASEAFIKTDTDDMTWEQQEARWKAAGETLNLELAARRLAAVAGDDEILRFGVKEGGTVGVISSVKPILDGLPKELRELHERFRKAVAKEVSAQRLVRSSMPMEPRPALEVADGGHSLVYTMPDEYKLKGILEKLAREIENADETKGDTPNDE